ncbi:methyltransferase domain-containing protein [Methylomarinum sp. Ch1-1]|uniref:tRNA 5-carboxymethoxyuridine methyltransferase n=1 Tax=Methylomarinum roseum TaxID=3067653 RepID=A0AAU7NX99_9GAMM|nr:methyltransferase domain-containing protein [Methylomarinum sp. Ch1-1]MDP4522296.1 methyltransferase domain-containing protein [Methylomarinum sp. Ch1-1]
MSDKQDRNFDKLIDKFEQKIYSTAKGDWRLKLIKEDLGFLHQRVPLDIWDAGCGFAQIGQWFAEQGHRLTLCDLSKKMLQRAQENFAEAGLPAEFHHRPAQSLAAELPDFDVVLLHAVLEWLADPLTSLRTIAQRVRPGGYLSLLFYNRNAMVYSNTLKGGWRLKNLLNDSYLGKGSKLTPPNPQYPHRVIAELEQCGFETIRHTGIRVFHDYLTPEALAHSAQDELFALEYRYCRMPTYRDMGRYVHILFRRQ